jgi:pimeloyl-ACP methyl ester carboxylesterase
MNPLHPRQYIAALDARAEHVKVPYAEGRTMHWRLFGRGEPLALVHGGHGSWLHWVRNIERLAESHRLLVPDLPGFGDSDDAPAGATLETLADAFAATLAQVASDRAPVDVAAFSLGAVVSAHAAVRGGVARRLALVGSPGTESPRRPRAEMIRWRHADEAAQNAAMRHNLLAHMLHTEEALDALGFESYVTAVKATRFRSHGTGSRSSLPKILASYRRPVLFLYGEHDVTGTPNEAQERLADPALQREFRVIADGGHWIQYERAEAVNAELARWFGSDDE